MTDEQKPKHPGGRPSKYRPEMCERFIELSKLGKDYNYIACHIDPENEPDGIAVSTLYCWQDPDSDQFHPEFSEAVEKGRQWYKMYWENKMEKACMQDELDPNKVVPSVLIFNAKNRIGWRDKKEVEHQGGVNVSILPEEEDV